MIRPLLSNTYNQIIALLQYLRQNKVSVVVNSKDDTDQNCAIECRTCDEVLQSHDNPHPIEERSLRDLWVNQRFTIDNQGELWGYHVPDNLWNGWQTPVFEKEELLRWLQEQLPGQDVRYDPDLDAIRCPEEGKDPDHQWAYGFDVLTADGIKRMYAPDGWCWDIAPDPMLKCLFGHYLKDHK